MRGKPRLAQLRDEDGYLKSPNWYIEYYAGGRSRRASTGHRIGEEDHEAQVALATFILERDRPRARELDSLTLAQALSDYYEEHAQFTATKGNAKRHEARLNTFFCGYTVANLTPSTIRKYVRDCQAEDRSNGTTRRELAHLSAALNHEVAEQRIMSAPRIVLPPPPPPRERILNQSEINRLLEACAAPHVRQFVEIMLATGQRPGAVESLTWHQVDFKERIIYFDKTVKKKTNKRTRPVPMTLSLHRLLKGMHHVRGDTGYVLEYAVTTREGEEIVRPAGCVRKGFERAVTRAKLEGVSRYTLRHTYGNLLDQHGVDDR
jgi:integrase